MGRVAERSALSPQEYLDWERQESVRHEFFRGEVFAMAGGSVRHNALCVNTSSELSRALRPRGCVVMSSDQPGVWIYRAAGAGEGIVLSGGAELLVDAIFDGVFALPADEPG